MQDSSISGAVRLIAASVRQSNDCTLTRAAIPAPRARIVLIDRPNSPQSVIMAGRVLPLAGRTPDMEAPDLANEVTAGGFLSRPGCDHS